VPLALTSDVVHLVSVSLWLGGLAMLALAVLPRRLPDELAAVVPRFSRIAFGAVIAILATGVFQGWREVRSKAALTDTTYGKLLIVKVVVFALLVALGGLSRRHVQARYRVPAAGRRLRVPRRQRTPRSFKPHEYSLGARRIAEAGDVGLPHRRDSHVGRLLL